MASVEYRGMNLVIPENDSEWREHFKLARANHRLMLRACTACGLMRYPPTHACPWCTDLGWTWHEVSGRGTIYSYEIVVHAIQPGFKEVAPYPVVLVELDEQRGAPTPDEALRMVANLVKPGGGMEDEKNVAIGKRVQFQQETTNRYEIVGVAGNVKHRALDATEKRAAGSEAGHARPPAAGGQRLRPQ